MTYLKIAKLKKHMIKQKTVLVIEDDKSLRKAIVDTLHLKKIEVVEAGNGEEGVKLALSKHPDLILLDLLMPKMDGMTAFKKIREDHWGKNVPVIILTNMSATDERLVEDMIKYKPLFYLVKSDFEINEVAKKIKDILAK